VEPLGFGYRQPEFCGVTLSDAADVAFSSNVLSSEPAIYVGHSAGAMLALELATCNPQALGVALVNGILDDLSDVMQRPLRYAWRHPFKSSQLALLLVYLIAKFPEALLRLLERGGSITAAGWPLIARPRLLSNECLSLLVRSNRCPGAWRHLRANRLYDLVGRANDVKVPVLAICGRRDPLATHPTRSRFLAACTTQVRTVLLDTGHHSPLEAPAHVAHALVLFANSVE
jgi:pimeloyl-ACP methyl ester carboxylesterase